MLNSPTADDMGYSNMFTSADFQSLQINGKNRPYALDACKWMKAADTFLAAYGKFDDTQRSRLSNELQIRLVMHVHQKKYSSRLAFQSMTLIARAMYDAAKEIDKTLPEWGSLVKSEQSKSRHGTHDTARVQAVAPMEAVSASSGLREIRADDVVDASVLMSLGFVVGVEVVEKDGGAGNVWTITECDDESEFIKLMKDPKVGGFSVHF